MEILGYEDIGFLLGEIGERLKRGRLAANMTQEELSKHSGVSASTINRMENGEDTKFSNILKVTRSLSMLPNITSFIPEEYVDLEEIVKEKPPKKRVRHKKEQETKFEWGD